MLRDLHKRDEVQELLPLRTVAERKHELWIERPDQLGRCLDRRGTETHLHHQDREIQPLESEVDPGRLQDTG